MDLSYIKEIPQGGFNYDNCLRNKALQESGNKGGPTQVKTMKTGTTICGVVFAVSIIFNF